MSAAHNLRFKGQLKSVMLSQVQYSEFTDSLCVGYDYIEEDTTLPLPVVKFNQAPTGATVIGRMMHLVQQVDSDTGNPRTKMKAAQIGASELRIFWVFGMTVPPIALQNAAKKILKAYDEFQNLNKYAKEKRGPSWLSKADNFNDRMLTGMNLATTDKLVIKRVEEEFELQMKKEDLLLVEDNCKVKTCNCSRKAVGN